MDTFEPLVKEFDIRVAFHNHAQQPKNPAYKVWDPKWVADLVRNRDSRIGACASRTYRQARLRVGSEGDRGEDLSTYLKYRRAWI